MEKEFSHLHEKEQLKAENDFLKMKLMLEKGAEFGAAGSDELNPEVENEFLKNVIEFEKQFDQQKTIKVFDKIGKPTQFKPPSLVPEDEIEKAWKTLSAWLYKHGISLGVCSPNISARELYRFTVEELFQYDMDDVDVPGIIHGFIYDEFHPDIIYDNTRTATEDCIQYILQKEPLEWMYNFQAENLRLNDHYPLTIGEFKTIVNRFKAAYDEMDLNEISDPQCVIMDKNCQARGKYIVALNTGVESYKLSGNWKVEFEVNAQTGYWSISAVEIENIRF